MKAPLFITLFLLICNISFSQPAYSTKGFLEEGDSLELRNKLNLSSTQSVQFYQTKMEIMDVDDYNTQHILIDVFLLLGLVSDTTSTSIKNGKHEYYVFMLHDKKPIKVWEKHYKNGRLHGPWYTYNLQGTLVSELNYRNDTLHGVSRDFSVDGKRIISEAEYVDDHVISKWYSSGGELLETITHKRYENVRDGDGLTYYRDGTLKEKMHYVNDKLEGKYQSFHPNGKIHEETIYKDGKPWEAIVNYTAAGELRDAGTLKEGSGILISYRDTGEIKSVKTYKDGVLVDRSWIREKGELYLAIERFNQAFKEGDVKTLTSMITYDYVHTNGTSKPINKSQWLDYLRKRSEDLSSGKLVVLAYSMEEMAIEILYGKTAIVTGKVIVETEMEGSLHKNEYRVTHVWTKYKNGWRRAGFHDSKIN
ncbi:DUF4440 domain-containing protein [Fulvivirga aurantia]|uniref:DUF4440 domain-containing protein n=1 Tax=Fulvivirga aurantia TaxID=2529383 RepID=UPI0016249B94|nr:DUF4440 domain-containing protein [Fulvivirga aurantia]